MSIEVLQLLACYLVAMGTPANNAIIGIREWRPGSIETFEQEDVVYEYERKSLIAELKTLANKRDVPYQPLVKIFLAEKVREENAPYDAPDKK